MLKRLYYPFLLFALAQPAAATVTEEQYQQVLHTWTNILQNHVDDQGRIDFNALAAEPKELSELVAFIESTSPTSLPQLFPSPEDVIAYHINAYNILAMYGVIDEGIPKGFNNFFKRAGFFKFRSVVIGGKKTSLYDYENKVIRPLDEPRAHFALNCMVRDCPRLPRHAFRAETLERQLDTAAREFFNTDKHIRIDEEKEAVYLSAIMDFYTKDFVPSGKARDLASYVNPYRAEPLPAAYKIKFMDYDWTINQQPK
jgi:hypothetical protein